MSRVTETARDGEGMASASPSGSSSSSSSTWLSPGLSDYLCGTLSGIGKVVVGYPFDTVKSRVQTGRFPNSVQAFWSTLRHEGPLAFYQGVAVPAATVCFVGGILFYVNGLIRRWIQPDVHAPLTYRQMLAAGSGAGFVVGCVLTPLEVVKVRLQVANRQCGGHSNVSAVIKSMRIRDFFSGATPTLIREVCTFGLFFPTNEYLKFHLCRWFPQPQRKQREEARIDAATAQMWIRVLAAGGGGVVGWFPCYPVDVVKSRMQVVPQGTYRTWMHCLAELYCNEGRRGLYRGLLPCLVRAFPAYAAQFLLFEYARALV